MSADVSLIGFLLFVSGVILWWRCQDSQPWEIERAATLDDSQLKEHVVVRYRRKLFRAGVLMVLGLAIPLGYQYFWQHPHSEYRLIFGIAALCLCFATIVSACLDLWASVRLHSATRRAARLRREQLNADVNELREQLRSRQ